MCASCARVWASPERAYEDAVSATVASAPEFCTCKTAGEPTRLLPDLDDATVTFSARVACGRCARQKAYTDAAKT